MALRVAIAPSDQESVYDIRLRWAAQALARAGEIELVPVGGELSVRHAVRQHGPELLESLGIRNLPDVDVLAMTRILAARIADVIPEIQRRGTAVVVDVDDDFRNLPPLMANRKKADLPLYSWRHTTRACAAADLVTVSTEALRRYAPHGRVVLLRNRVPEGYLRVQAKRDGKTVGWAGAALSHPGDLEITHGGVGMALRETDADFMVVGPAEHVQKALDLPARPWATGIVEHMVYPLKVAEFDVGIAPLADNAFNRSKCLDIATLVMTDSGVMPIGEVCPSDRVWHGDRWRMVEAVERSPRTLGFCVETSLGLRLRLTPNHRLRSAGVWRRADELSVGMALDLDGENWPQSIPYAQAAWPAESRMSRRRDVDPQGFVSAESGPRITVDERWGRLLGLYAGDGCGGSGGNVLFSMDGQDADLIAMLMEDLRAIGLHAITETEKYARNGELLRRRSVQVSSMSLVRALEAMGVCERRPGGGTRRIVRVPELLWRSPRSVVVAFLAGLFEADGTASGTVRLCTKEEHFARDVQRLLVGLGIFCRVYGRAGSVNRRDGRDYSDRIYWYISLRRASVDVFAREIGFLSERKRQRLAASASKPHGNAYRPMPAVDEIVAITPCEVGPVDLQVEGSVFTASGIVSHNSWIKPLQYLSLGVPCVVSNTMEYELLARELVAFEPSSPCPLELAKPRSRDWRSKLVRALSYPEEIKRERIDLARRFVAERHTVEGNAWRWAEAWAQARALRAAA